MFEDIINKVDWQKTAEEIRSKTEKEVRLALQSKRLDIEDFKALVSPAAEAFLEEMAVRSRESVQKRFGKTIQFYIPLYLSNECSNHCIYCGFNHNNDIKRKTLNEDEIREEARIIKTMGYEHILLLTGEAPQHVGIDYIEKAMQLLKPDFAQLSLEVYPMSTEEYVRLRASGLHAVYIYQETYQNLLTLF